VNLVFDENLSPRLPGLLEICFEGAVHVEDLGLTGRDDSQIWQKARLIEDAIIMTKDDDFRERALVDGPPPKVIILLVGNCSTRSIESLLRRNIQLICEFAKNESAALLELPA